MNKEFDTRMNNRNIPPITPQDTPQDTPPVTPLLTSHRLSLVAYEELERKVAQPHTTPDTTAIQAGFQLGVQSVLRLLRVGFVVGT